jgi:hypothetical protein
LLFVVCIKFQQRVVSCINGCLAPKNWFHVYVVPVAATVSVNTWF